MSPRSAPHPEAASSHDQWARDRAWVERAVRSRRWWLGANTSPLARAAAVLVVAGAMLVFWQTVHVTSHGGRLYAAAPGQQEKISLPDGTTFVLAPGSQVRLASDYGRARRDLALDGEAFFAVKHDATHPFAVHAHNVVATDIGTQFDVRAYDQDNVVRVVVAEGQVGLLTRRGGILAARGRAAPDQARGTTLSRGDAAVIDTALAVTHGADVAELTAWTQGKLVFDATPLPEVARELGRWYGADIVIATPALAEQHITAAYTNQPLADVLELLAHAIGGHVDQHGRTIVLR